MPERRNVQFRSAANGKSNDAAKAGLRWPFTGNIEESRGAAPSDHQRNILHAVDEVSHRSGHNPGSSVELPKFLPVGRTKRGKHSVGASLKHQVSRSGEDAAAFGDWIRDLPRLALLNRIPGNDFPDGRWHGQPLFEQRSVIMSVASVVH